MPSNPADHPFADEQSPSLSRRGFLQSAIAAAAVVKAPAVHAGDAPAPAAARMLSGGRRAFRLVAAHCGTSLDARRSYVGWGMATATYPANRQGAKASAINRADGTAVVRSGAHDLGTGTYTVMTQIAAEALGMPVSKVYFELGDTGLPEAPVSGGSQTVASVGPAMHAAAKAAREKLVALAVGDASSPLRGLGADAVVADNGWLIDRSKPDRRELMASVIARHGGQRPLDDLKEWLDRAITGV